MGLILTQKFFAEITHDQNVILDLKYSIHRTDNSIKLSRPMTHVSNLQNQMRSINRTERGE